MRQLLRRIPFICINIFSNKIKAAFFCSFLLLQASAQQNENIHDTGTLANITVTAFSSQSKWKDAAASVAVLNKYSLQRFDNNSMVTALNSVTGVRMEERSPGSYRLSLRGSLLRSPFGVRNVKVYWDDIPLTDATGNTYLQLLDINTLQGIQIVKGPAASYYGANTGGTVLLESDTHFSADKNIFNAGLSGGSFGLLNEQLAWKYSGKKFISNLQQGHVQSNGYRQNSALRRDMIRWNGLLNLNDKEQLSFLAFYSNLHYETPGGITKAQMDSLPILARQPTPTLPGAVQQKAGVYNETIFAGVSLKSVLSKSIFNKTSIAVNHTNFRNPFITNYEKRNELNITARTDFGYTWQANKFSLQANAGGEFLYNHSNINVYGNKSGVADTVLYKDKVKTTQYFLFAQVKVQAGNHFEIQAGVSNNQVQYNYTRLTNTSGIYPVKKNAGPTLSPRVSLLYKLSATVSVYAIAAKGFSPPTLAEVLPSNGAFTKELNPEYGWNYEAGIKGSLFKNAVEFNASWYYFELKDAIVRRTDAAGAEYFINAGGTFQRGAELWLNSYLLRKPQNFISSLNIWNSLSYQPYRFGEYVVGANKYSGNKLTGVPRFVNVSGASIGTKNNFYLNACFNYTSAIRLNDANTVDAKPYHLLQIKLGKTFSFNECKLELFAGADNVLNELYSLGNDLNATGSRYFNPAPVRNYYGGARLFF